VCVADELLVSGCRAGCSPACVTRPVEFATCAWHEAALVDASVPQRMTAPPAC
jgi:hypothetical protein